MKSVYIIMITLLIASAPLLAQTDCASQYLPDGATDKTSIRRINFYVVNKPKTLDLFSRLVVLRARKKGMTRRDKFIVIVATSAKQARNKMEDHLQKKNAIIGSL